LTGKITTEADFTPIQHFSETNITPNTYNPKPSKHIGVERSMVETIQGHRGGFTDVTAMASSSNHGADAPGGWLAHLTPAEPVPQAPIIPIGDEPHREESKGKPITYPVRSPKQQKTIVVHYSVPAGQAFLPINLDETVTMIQIGDHYGQGVFEPINTYLRSNEEGLRFYRSMSPNDPHDGLLGVAPWHVAAVGGTSEGKNLLFATVKYDPTTRPRLSVEEAVAAGAARRPGDLEGAQSGRPTPALSPRNQRADLSPRGMQLSESSKANRTPNEKRRPALSSKSTCESS
jgi:hypothetical protein